MNICYLMTSSLLLLFSASSGVTAQGDSSLGMVDEMPGPSSETAETSKSSRYFDIYVGNKRIGSYEATMTRRGNTTEYRAKSETVVRIIGEIRIGYDLVCTYENDILVKSRVRSYRNGNLKSETIVNWTGTHYLINKDGDKSTAKTPVTMSSIKLYFEGPPKELKQIFSEREGRMKQVRNVEDQQYLVADAGKNRGTEFVYNNARLEEVNIAFTLGSFSLVNPR